MFQKVNQIALSPSGKYLINVNSILIADQSNLYCLDIISGQEKGILKFDKEIQELIDYGKEVIVFMGKKSSRVNVEEWHIITDPQFDAFRLRPRSPFENKILVRLPGKDEISTVNGLYDIAIKKLLWTNDQLTNPLIISGHLFSYNDSEMRYHRLETSENIWKLSVKELGRHYFIADKEWKDGKLKELLGIHNDILWVLLYNASIIGIAMETGSSLYEIKGPSSVPSKFGKLEDKGYNFWYNYNSLLDEQQGKIIALLYSGYSTEQFNCYYEIDLNSSHPQLVVSEIKNITDIPFKIDGNPCPIWPFDDEYVYLCNYRDYKLALFNRKTKQIDWVHQMEIDSVNRSFIIKMKVQGTRWYVLDNSKTLHVYEKA